MYGSLGKKEEKIEYAPAIKSQDTFTCGTGETHGAGTHGVAQTNEAKPKTGARKAGLFVPAGLGDEIKVVERNEESSKEHERKEEIKDHES